MPRPLPLVLTVAALSAPLLARAAPLGIGSPAPALKVAKWVKGTPIPRFEKGKLYVVEFWATWCGPCKTSIPHLTEMAKKYKGKVSFTGVSVFEHDPKYGPKVAAFVKEMGPKMGYNVAMDDDPNSGFMAKNWMIAAKQDGIPTAFIVGKDGKIAWIGHPMDMEKPLAAIVAGTFDAKSEAARVAKEKQAEENFQAELGKVDPLAKSGKVAEAVAILDKIALQNPSQADSMRFVKFDLLLHVDEPQAYSFARMLAESSGKANPMLLNTLAWEILDGKNAKNPDYVLALDLARKASAGTGDKNWQVLDTLALAQFKKGDIDTAIATEKKAIEWMDKAPGVPAEAKKELTDRLAEFVKAKG